ncbi:MAG: membrane protein insertion efficiency factor YidD [Bacillota bacterium]|jgi:putative component of membrane protein insertase Oxa1/YidC/SpoIIIJ protein YidD
MEMPSQEEQIIAEEYVLERPLDRPDTDIKKAVKSVVVYLLSSLVMGFSMLYLFSWLGIFALFSDCICDFREQHSIWFSIIFILLVYFIVGLFCLKKAVIGCIKLYQHYAPEQIRRRCLFKPTCSEYAILAIQKYGLIIGLIKSYIRLFKKCRGNIYRIDYP